MLIKILKHITRSKTSFVRSQHFGQRLNIGGIFPPIATPFTKEGLVDYKSLEENIRQYGNLPFKGKHTN